MPQPRRRISEPLSAAALAQLFPSSSEWKLDGEGSHLLADATEITGSRPSASLLADSHLAARWQLTHGRRSLA